MNRRIRSEDMPTRPVSGVRNIHTALTRPVQPAGTEEHRTIAIEHGLAARVAGCHRR